MHYRGVLRQACVAATLLFALVSVARAHNIEIKFDPGGATANGTINFNFFTDNSGPFALTKFSINVRSGWTGQNIAMFMAASMNANPLVSLAYTATVGTETVPGPFGVTYDTVTVTPIAGLGADFDFGSFYIPPAKDPKLTGAGVKVHSTAPATTTLDLVVNGAFDSALIDWKLGVVDQAGNLVGMVALPGVPNNTSPSTLISMFDSGLVGQGIPSVATGNLLSLTTADNDFFVLTRSAPGSLDFTITDGVIPEPATLSLFGGGLLALIVGMRGRMGKRG